MAAATTTLPLFWHLSSADKSARIDASVKLVSALQQFQDKFVTEVGQEVSTESRDEIEGDDDDDPAGNDEEYEPYSSKLDAGNAADVAYAIRRLIRGLASPRESSRLGFAVALTELLARIDTVSCQQILVLLKNASQTTSSMSGQEERDMLFARLFGLKSIIQSGLIFRQKPLRTSSTSSSSLKAYEIFLTELLALGEKKSWLRESCWWTLTSAVDALNSSDVPWKRAAFDMLFDRIFVGDKLWSPEKVALMLKLQKTHQDVDWNTYCGSYFKSTDILATTNLALLGRLLKDSVSEDMTEGEASKHSAGPWKPQLHFVWDVILDALLAVDGSSTSSGKFQDFYRIVVDETLFSSSSSPQRKYWGFQMFQRVVRRLPSAKLSLLFTKNFMRTWINQLSKNDRYLHKIARQVASDIQEIVEEDPKTGFTLVVQLTGTNGSFHFDRITKTKTVETILAKMDNDGIKEYIDYLLKQVNEGEESDSFASIDARRTWIVDQMSGLIRKGSIPKDDETIRIVLDWLTTHAFFTVKKRSSKSTNFALRVVPEPPFSEELRELCSSKLLACLGDLTGMSAAIEKKDDAKVNKANGFAMDGNSWVLKTLLLIIELEKDVKHAAISHKFSGDERQLRDETLTTVNKIKKSSGSREPTGGVEQLLCALLLKCLCDSEGEADWDSLRDCITASNKLFVSSNGNKSKKKNTGDNKDDADDGDRTPIDLIVDIIIGLLEQSTSFTRAVANQSFAMLSSLITDSTIDLILAQLERRDPTSEDVDDDDGVEETEDDDDVSSPTGEDEDEDIVDEEGTESLRKALEAAVSSKEFDGDGDTSDDDSDEASMDDEQMMQIDEKLAAVFRTRAEERKKGKDVGAQREATYFKNRVLDLVETFMKRQPSSNLVLRFVLPLVELVSTASSDEKQLRDKAKGILRARLAKTKDAPVVDVPKAIALLESLHQRARKAHSSDTVATIGPCSLFVTKALLASGEQTAVVRVYEESILDFVTRKASAINPAFVLDFIRRHPVQAWSLHKSAVGMTTNATNGYRQTQAFNIVQTIFTSLPQPESKKEEIMSSMPLVSEAFLTAVSSSCSSDSPMMTAVQLKDALKVASQLCRFSKRFFSDTATLKNAWQPEKWDKMAAALSSSEQFKSSTSLAKTCQQISQLAQSSSLSKKTSSGLTMDRIKPVLKRKQEDAAEDEDNESKIKKPKRKKVRKAPKTVSKE
ncbi:hypothetical protein M0805_003011 [Coniferiporia weirii]|nr:hypothetical protein M0805_003011 [Coniferiporia weirii]